MLKCMLCVCNDIVILMMFDVDVVCVCNDIVILMMFDVDVLTILR